MRTDRYVYAVRSRGKKDGWNKAYSDVYIEDYLYDTAKDPCETRNLIRDPSYRGVKRDLAERLERFAQEAGEPPFVIKRRIFAPKK